MRRRRQAVRAVRPPISSYDTPVHQQLNMLATHLTTAQLEAGLDAIRNSPKDAGELQLIVRRPRVNHREVLEEGRLDSAVGLVGDTWQVRPSSKMPDKTSPHPERQITIMNARVAALVAQHPDRWALAGDQLFIDLDLADSNLPPGTRLSLGSAVLELTPQAHTGCASSRHLRARRDGRRHPARRRCQ